MDEIKDNLRNLDSNYFTVFLQSFIEPARIKRYSVALATASFRSNTGVELKKVIFWAAVQHRVYGKTSCLGWLFA